MPIDRFSPHRVATYGEHSFSNKTQSMAPVKPSESSWGATSASPRHQEREKAQKVLNTLDSLPKVFPQNAVDRQLLDRPAGLLERRITLLDRSETTTDPTQKFRINNALKANQEHYKGSMQDLHKESAHGQLHNPSEQNRNRLSNWSDILLNTNKDISFLPK